MSAQARNFIYPTSNSSMTLVNEVSVYLSDTCSRSFIQMNQENRIVSGDKIKQPESVKIERTSKVLQVQA